MNLFIEPMDVWLFRDGRPFSAGDDHRAVSFFPPTPFTIQGMLRSKVLLASDVPLDDYAHKRESAEAVAHKIGWPDDKVLPFRLRGPVVGRRSGPNTAERFFPLPADAVRTETGWMTLRVGDEALPANWPTAALRPLLPPTGTPQKVIGGWLAEGDLCAYLSDETFAVACSGDLFRREPRFSVHLSTATKTHEEGHLFAVEFIRPCRGVGLLVGVDPLDLPSTGLLAAGGEGRAAQYEEVETGFGLPPRALRQAGGPTRFKAYLASPACFSGDWLPGWLDPDSLHGTFGGVEVQLVAAACGRPQPLGGFDLARSQQKPLRRAVPAGSVYYFESPAAPEAVSAAFDGQCLSDAEADHRLGLGLAYVGTWEGEADV